MYCFAFWWHFRLIWNTYFYQKNIYQFSEQLFFLENTINRWHHSKAFTVSFQCHRLQLWSTGSDRSQSSVENSMQEELSEIAVVQISRTEYIMQCNHDMVDQIPQKRILRPWNQWESHCLHRRPHIRNSRTSGASHAHNTRELALKQKLIFHQVGDTIKRHHMCRTRHFRWKGQLCHRNSAFKHTTWSTTLSPNDDATLVQFD